MVYKDWGRFNEARNLFEEALAIQKVLFGYEHQHTAATLAALADNYAILGEFESAEHSFMEALKILSEGR